MKKQASAMLALLFCTLLAFTGCSGNISESGDGKKTIVIAVNSETGSLDPAGMIALTYLSYSVTALDELLTFDEQGGIEYRAATSYEVNEEMTVWTFHLREGARWSDGTLVTAEDFLNTIQRSLDPASRNGYANYLFPIKNAEAVYEGSADIDSLGVEIPDDNTLIFHLEEPCVYFLDLLRLPVYTPSCRKYADAALSGWDKNPDTSVANGPFCLAKYVPEQYFTLKKNEYYWNADAVHLDTIMYRFFADQQSMASAYEAGEVDVAVSLPSSVMKLYEGKEDLVVTEQMATRYIYPNLEVSPLDDMRVRKALSLALDRKELCTIVGEDTEPTVNLVAKYMKDSTGKQTFTEQGGILFEEDLSQAKELLAEAGYPDGEGFPALTYQYPALEMDSDTAQVLKEQWKRNLNIDIELKAQELQVNYSDRYAGNFELCRMNWTADFSDPYTYLSLLLSNSTYNCSGINDAKYDALVRASGIEKDVDKRNDLLHEAERLAVGEQFYVIPLFSVKSCNLIRPGITGITQNAASGALEYRYADRE